MMNAYDEIFAGVKSVADLEHAIARRMAVADKPRKATTKAKKAQPRAEKALGTVAQPASPPMPPNVAPDNSPAEAGPSSAGQT